MMTPEVFAAAIVSIEQNYGLRLDARSVWLRMDDWKRLGRDQMGQKCGRGWQGLRGACKRVPPGGDKDAAIKASKVALADRIRKNKGMRDRNAPKVEPPKVEPVKSAESPIETITNTGSSKFDRVTGLKDLDKDWGESIKEGQKYMDSDMQHLNESIESVEYLQGEANELKPKEEKTFWYQGGQKSANKEEWIERFSKDRSALKQKIKIKLAEMGTEKDLGTDGTEKLRANLSIIASIQEVKNKKSNDRNTITGGVTVGGKLQAAYVLTKKNDHLYVEYLAANPSNFLGKSGATKGAGRAAIVDIVKRSFEEGHKGRVQLESLTGAEGFYKKMGFTMSDRGDFRLSTEQAKKILEGKS